MTATSTTV